MSGRRDYTIKGQERALELRGRATPAERALRELLDSARISYVFQSFAHDNNHLYIADFRIKRPTAKKGEKQRLYVELDGSSHVDRERYDATRQRWFEERRNAIVLRFSNETVLNRPQEVLATIMAYGPALKTDSLVV